mmetsp:Transcript_19559/g.50517  ORF Transcript_19559/g.50517 Transcript_19559/m.50517 type:complete len:158 (-) Transcript_19559:165-638(-)
MISQLQSIQQRDSSKPSSIVVIGDETTTVLQRQIIELLSYALVLSGNRVLTTANSGADEAVARGALRANERMLTIVVANSMNSMSESTREDLSGVRNVVELRHTGLSPELEAKLVYAELLGGAEKLIAFAFHRSRMLRQTIDQALALNIECTVLFLD